MPIHDWTRVDAGIFHAFHHDWITEISRALNRGILPDSFYALPEQIAGGRGPDVLTLQGPVAKAPDEEPTGGVALATSPPRVQMRLKAESDWYAVKAKAVVIRHASDHRVIAVIEVVSPGNKNSRSGLRSFVAKAEDLLHAGIHLLLIDLVPPGSRDPEGIHKLIWDEMTDNDFKLPPGKTLTLAAYRAGIAPEAFLEFASVGEALANMPLLLSQEFYVWVPLEATYQAAFDGMPAYWRSVLSVS